MKLRYIVPVLILYSASLTACQSTPTPTLTPTTIPTLNVSLWVDYPVVSISLFTSKKYTQYANVVVMDVSGRPVAGATVLGQREFAKGARAIIFPVTDAKGQARAPLEISPLTAASTHTISVTAIRNADWSITAITSFDVQP